ncbi:hypothetical protein BURPS1710b_0391 [Burkholderia pseudomallei 1710b]|uniref:Uncharacterized protein n=1 Tax=Burkholderia pseudomallei (strain 1710b) TaxID=320372 RepID=Q3JX98_BURP1|nr:hypothetical protein BURPS1710b_0391 [Burkholderia pseudomallei 1710b]
MIDARAEPLEDARVDLRVGRRARDDLLEQVHVDRAGARVREQQAARAQQLQAAQVDVLVRARRAIDAVARRRELRRIEHDQVEALAFVDEAAQRLERVGVEPLRARGVEAVRGDVALRERERVARRIDRHDPLRAALERREREAARVAEAVQHVAIARVLRDERAVLALVDVEARLVAVAHVDVIQHAVLVRDQRVGRRVAREHAGRLFEPFLFADRHVRALVDVRAAGGRDERRDDRALPVLDARRHELADELAATLAVARRDRRGRAAFGRARGGVAGVGGASRRDVVIDDEPRQPVRLAEHEPHRVRARDHRAAMRERALHAPLEERVVDRLVLVEAPHAQPDLRMRAVRGAREEAPVVRAHDDGRAGRGLAVDAVDRVRVDPRVAAQQGFVFRRLERNGMHVGIEMAARGAAECDSGIRRFSDAARAAARVSRAFSRADARCRKSSRDAGSRATYRPASPRCSRARAAPAPRAGRRSIAARASRTSGAVRADERSPECPPRAPRASRARARRRATSGCRAPRGRAVADRASRIRRAPRARRAARRAPCGRRAPCAPCRPCRAR